MSNVSFRSGGLVQKILTGILILLLLAFWVIALAGTAATQASCVKLKPTTGGTGRRLMEAQPEGFSPNEPLFMGRQLLSERHLLASSDEKYCNNLVKFLWWGVWFEFLCLILAVLCAIVPAIMSNMGKTTTLFFVMCTVVLMIQADNFNSQIYIYDNTFTDSRYNDLLSGLQAGMAGTVGLLVLNFLYLMGMTIGDDYGYASSAGAAPITQPGQELKTTNSSNPAYPPQSTPSYGQPAPYSPNAQPYAPGPGPQGYSPQGSPPPMQPYSPPPNPYYVQQGPPGAAPAAGGPPPS